MGMCAIRKDLENTINAPKGALVVAQFIARS
jgi:hypothetical protein